VRDQNAKLRSDRQLTNQAQSLADQVGSQPLVAPVSGYIVDCVDRPANVLQPSTPLFDIYSPDRAYVLAYFNPDSVGRIHLGEAVGVSIAGLSHDVTGQIVAVYPDLARLPPQLTKFFWQHVQFSEFRPVKIALDGISAADRGRLYYDAQARVYIGRDQDASPTVSAVQ
jgi:multidrug resistance efflux pump